MSTAVVMTTHRLHPEILDRFRRLARAAGADDTFLLADRDAADTDALDRTRDLGGAHLVEFRKRELRALPYPRKTGDSPFLDNCDLMWMWFVRSRPDHDRYWFVEYDVAYSGDWADLFRHFADDRADLLTTTLKRYSPGAAWPHWRSLDAPVDLEPRDRIRGFLPIARLSRTALQTLDEAYRRGWGGHAEVTVPTILHRRGLEIEDIGGRGPFVRAGNRDRFYTNRAHGQTLLPETFVYRPARGRPGLRRHMLWHPVKPDQGRFLPHARHLWRRARGLVGSALDRGRMTAARTRP